MNVDLLKFHPGERRFYSSSGKIVPLTADGNVFSHPLMHMGKTVYDLPILAIDSFQHMFLYPGDLNTALTDPKYVNQFILDLQSEKLHRQFHGVPEKTPVEVSINHPYSRLYDNVFSVEHGWMSIYVFWSGQPFILSVCHSHYSEGLMAKD